LKVRRSKNLSGSEFHLSLLTGTGTIYFSGYPNDIFLVVKKILL